MTGRRGIAACLLVAGVLLVVAAPARAAQDDPPGQQKNRGNSGAAVRVELAADCVDADLHRFVVTRRSGPPVTATISVDGRVQGELEIKPPERTFGFWVPVAEPGRTTVAWDGGSVTQPQTTRPCEQSAVGDGELPEIEPDDPVEGADAPRAGGDDGAAERGRAGGTAEGGGDGPRQRQDRAEAPDDAGGDGTVSGRAPSGGETAAAGAPRPAAEDRGSVCPTDYREVAVASEDGVVCEIVRTSVQRPVTSGWTTAALIVTMGLLIVSLGLVANARRG